MKKNLHIIIIAIIFSIILWVSISLSNEYYTTVKVPIKIVNFPDGLTTGTRLPAFVSLKLKGQGWKLVSLALGREPNYLINAGKDSGRNFVDLSNYSVENQWLSSNVQVIDITPDTLSYFLEKITSTKVEIIPNLNLNFKQGFGLASKIKIVPDSTIVYGPASKIKNLRAVQTEIVNLNNLDDKFEDKIKLASMPGMTYENNSVNISLDVQKIAEKDFSVTVNTIDVPIDRDVVLIPNKISVGLRGGVDVLAKLSEKNINAQVNYRGVVLDTLGSIVPKVEVPSNATLIYVKPERLRYIIKKFN